MLRTGPRRLCHIDPPWKTVENRDSLSFGPARPVAREPVEYWPWARAQGTTTPTPTNSPPGRTTVETVVRGSGVGAKTGRPAVGPHLDSANGSPPRVNVPRRHETHHISPKNKSPDSSTTYRIQLPLPGDPTVFYDRDRALCSLGGSSGGVRGREAVKQSDFRQGWNLSRGGAVPWGCVGRPSVLPFEFRRRSGEPAGARFSPWRGLAGAFRLAPYAGSGANSNRRCRLNVSAAHAASQLTFSSPRVANRRSFNFVLIQALGNSASGARCL